MFVNVFNIFCIFCTVPTMATVLAIALAMAVGMGRLVAMVMA